MSCIAKDIVTAVCENVFLNILFGFMLEISLQL